ncbi:MAG: hypothetical protein ACSLE9_16560 [Burkholderiaceae bacterium]
MQALSIDTAGLAFALVAMGLFIGVSPTSCAESRGAFPGGPGRVDRRREESMFNKIQIANRGDQPRSGAATKSHRVGTRSVRRRSSHGSRHV